MKARGASAGSRYDRALGVLAAAFFFGSGAAGLVYEVLWFRLLILKLGGTGLSVATVTAAFMAGLGIGAWLFGTRVALRVPPLRLYGLLEIAIGLYAVAVPSLISLAGRVDAALLGAEPGPGGRVVRFVLAGAVLLPPTLCMGGTLPVLSRLVEGSGVAPGRFVGLLYGVNTIGAVLGAGLCGFVLMPRLGLTATLGVAAGVNVALGGTVLLLARGGRFAPAAAAAREAERTSLEEVLRPRTALLASSMSGFIGFVLQVSWTRILALVFGSSVYAFSLILVIFLLGLGAGAVFGALFSARARSARAALAWCFVLAGAITVLGQGAYGLLPKLYLQAIVSSGGRHSLGSAAGLAALLLLPPTLLLGAGFPLIVRLATGSRGRDAAAGVGRIYACNTAGCVVGAWSAALWLIPTVGLAGTVSLASFLAMGLGMVLALARDGARSVARPLAAAAAPALGVGAVVVWLSVLPAWDRSLMSMGVGLWGPHAHAAGHDVFRDLQSLSGDRVLFYRDGVTATVAVKEATTRSGTQRYMTVDGHIEASTGADMATQVLLAHMPLLAAHARGANVLVIGHASGVTVGSVLRHPVASVTVVEIEESVLDGSRFFDEVNHRPLEDPRTRFVPNDARAFLERTPQRFDVVISEPSSVWFSGPAKLFTRENFALVRARLERGGVLGQWLTSYDLSPEDVLTVVRTARDVFPHVAVAQLAAGDLLLIASDDPIRFDVRALAQAWSDAAIQADLWRAGLTGFCGLLECIAAEPEAVDAGMTPGPLNTDDNALLEYRGARSAGTQGGVEALAQLAARSRGPAAVADGLGADGPLRAGPLAARCLAEGAARAARSLALRGLAEAPDGDALWVLGETLRAEGRPDAALVKFDEALRLEPGHVRSAVSAALALQELGRLPEALAAWARAATVAPQDPIVPAWSGVAQLELGRADRALLDFHSARAMAAGRPAPIPIDLYEARALQELGRDTEARPLLERYLDGLAPGVDAPRRVAGLERLARSLSRSADAAPRAAELSSLAAAERRRLGQPILAEALRILDDAGDPRARAFLRELTGMDPALRDELERQAATLPGETRRRAETLVRSLPAGSRPASGP